MAKATQDNEIRQTRFPLFGNINARGTDENKDQRYVNCFPESSTNSETGNKKYTLIKRAGYSLTSTVKGAGGVGRALAIWRSKTYSIIDNTIYSNTTNIGTIGTSTGYVSIAEMSRNAGTPYLCISDGAKLYLVSTSDVVTTIDNTQVQSLSITNVGSGGAPVSGTWATSGGGGAGATGTFTITGGILSATSVTTRGTGYTSVPTITISTGALPTGGALLANLCAFPPVNIISITYMDGYIFAGTLEGRIYNSDVGDPTLWQPSNYIAAEMFQDDLVALSRQNNMLVSLGKSSTQFFYNAANPTGSPLANTEQAVLQFGTINNRCVVSHESYLAWVAEAETGGYSVIRLNGTSDIKKISTEPIERILNAEGSSLATALAYPIRYQGHFWYVLKLSSRTLLYDYDEDMWHDWESTSGGNFPMIECQEFNYVPIMLHESDGKLYSLDASLYQDNGVNFSAKMITSRVDLESSRRKFLNKLELGGDVQSTTSIITVEYSDDDYLTWSAPRILDMANSHNFLKQLGSFRRRAFRLIHMANTPMRLEYLELETTEADY